MGRTGRSRDAPDMKPAQRSKGSGRARRLAAGARAKRKPAAKRTSSRDVAAPEPAQNARTPTAVVGLGASAGGLEAFKTFFQNMPSDSGMAFVLVTHLDPSQKSVLGELIAGQTRMPVVEMRAKTTVARDHVYVMSPGAPLRIERGVLIPAAPSLTHERAPIDRFFRSLAEDQGERAICIVLSGTGADGALGLRAVKEHGGLALAQEAASARYDGMPLSATATGLVDQMLPVEKMPGMLVDYVRHLERMAGERDGNGLLADAEASLGPLLTLVKHQTGHDFSQYKRNTLIRRVQRRIHVVQAASVGRYLEHVHKNPKEIELLFRDLLIGVTLFFRDPESFAALGKDVIPKILARKPLETPVRAWVCACATGEEAYSLAILFAEHLARMRKPPELQIFATDIDARALEVARQARYPEGIEGQVSPARLSRFFTREGNLYRVNQAIRDMVIFSRHDVTRDPPFSRLDLIACRNLLIYMEPGLQKRLLGLYHYALRRGGYLLLGSSEAISEPSSLFRTVDKKRRIFQQRPSVAPPPVSFSLSAPRPGALPPRAHVMPPAEKDLGKLLERIMLEQFAPASVVVDERGEAVYFSGNTGRFLQPSSGAPSANVLNMARKGLRVDLRAALRQAVETRREVVQQGIAVQTNGETERVDLIVRPLRELADAGLLLVVFREPPARKEKPRKRVREGTQDVADQLESELRSTKAHLQSTIEELETANEELKSSNEELLSMNEEQQSANEELQTSKEELQSVNEELGTVNAELSEKVEELDTSNGDLQNLLQSTQIPTLFLSRELRINKFTAAATEVFRLIETDVGRPIGDITPRFADGELEPEIKKVLRTLATREKKVRLVEREGWYLMRISPYRTVHQVIDGVVVTFVDVTELERSRDQAARLAAIVTSSSDAIYALSADGRITTWNKGAERIFGWSSAEVVGQSKSMLLPPGFPEKTGGILDRVLIGEDIVGLETKRIRKDGVIVDVSLTCCPIEASPGNPRFVSVVARDITDQKRALQRLAKSNEALSRSNEDLKHLSYAAAHDLKEPLRMIANYAKLLSQSSATALDEKGRGFLGRVVDGAKQLDSLLDALQEYWSVGRFDAERQSVDTQRVFERAVENLRPTLTEAKAEVTSSTLPTIFSKETPILEVFQNLIANAVKYRREGVAPRVQVGAERTEEGWRFSVHDNGMGVPAKHRTAIFLPFKRLHGAHIPGTGMGLAICHRIVEGFGGRMWVEPAGEGSVFRFTLPVEPST